LQTYHLFFKYRQNVVSDYPVITCHFLHTEPGPAPGREGVLAPVQTFPDSLCLAKEKMPDQQYEKTNKEDRLSAASNQKASGETTARPDDLSSVHFSLADIEEDDNRC